jgi:hypothetical protein
MANGPVKAEVVPSGSQLPNANLDEIAAYAKRKFTQALDYADRAVDARLEVGAALSAARVILKSNQAYGRWFKAQGFPFGIRWANQLLAAGAHEHEVRQELAKQVEALPPGKQPNFEKAVQAAVPAKKKPGQVEPIVDSCGVDNSHAESMRILEHWLKSAAATIGSDNERLALVRLLKKYLNQIESA